MPLHKEWSPNGHSLAAIWHITEPESFFSDKTGLSPDIRHPRKRIEHLCGRYLLRHLEEDFPLHHIVPDEHDKPRLPENRYFFSISHSYPYVAAVISDSEECGIDIQVWKDGMESIARMFLSEEEQALCADSRMMTVAWAAKEAAYKWWGRRGADFIRDLPIAAMDAGKTEINYSPDFLAPVQLSMSCFGVPIWPECWLHKDFALASITRHRPADRN